MHCQNYIYPLLNKKDMKQLHSVVIKKYPDDKF